MHQLFPYNPGRIKPIIFVIVAFVPFSGMLAYT